MQKKVYQRDIPDNAVEARTSSSGVKSPTKLKSCLISSEDFPLIMSATTLHEISLPSGVRETQNFTYDAGSDKQQGLDIEVVRGQDDLK